MRTAVLIALLSVAFVRAGEFDKEQLRPLLRFPQENFQVGFTFTQDGLRLLDTEVDPAPTPQEQLARAELRRAIDPDNPDHFRDLAQLYQSTGNSNAAGAMLAEAESRYRTTLSGTNRSAAALASGFAEVLRARGKHAEAEKFLRDEVQRSPKEQQAWIALGEHHTVAAYVQLTGGQGHLANPIEIQQAVLNRTPEELAVVQKHFSEAIASYGRAIQLSPNDSAPVRRQMIVQIHADMVRDFTRKEAAQAERALPNMFARYVPGLRQIAKLEPFNPEALAASMFAELMAGLIDGDIPALLSDSSETKLSAETRAVLSKGNVKLKKLSKKGDAHHRQVALVNLGFFQSMLGEKSAGEKSVENGIALDRSRPLGWEMLSGLYVLAEPPRWQDLLALSRERSKYNDSPRNRFIAAKAAERINDPVRAMLELQAGLKLDPRHANSQLAMCVLHLREGSRGSIEKAHAMIAELVQRKDMEYDQWRELMILGGACFALAEQHDTARQWFSSLLQHEPNDERGRAAMAAWKE